MSGALHGSLIGMQGIRYALPTAASDVSAGVSAVASLQLTNAGAYVCQGNTLGVTQSGNWITPTGLAPGSYTIRLRVDSGTNPVGDALDTDLALSSTRTWTMTRATVGTDSANCTLILKDGSGNTVASTSFTWTANRAI